MNTHFNTKLQRIKADLYALRDEVVTARAGHTLAHTYDNHSLFHLQNDIEQALSHVAEAQVDAREYMEVSC